MYNVGNEVGVILRNSWGRDHLQGLYRVTKSNKTRVHIQRVSDGYERIFSAMTGVEKGSTRYRSAEIISVDRYRQMEKLNDINDYENAWREIESLASKKDLFGLKNAIANLESA